MSKNEIVISKRTCLIKKKEGTFESFNLNLVKHQNHCTVRLAWAFLTNKRLSNKGKGKIKFLFPAMGTCFYTADKIEQVEIEVKACNINKYVRKEAKKKKIYGTYQKGYGYLYPHIFLVEVLTKKLKSLERKARKELK